MDKRSLIKLIFDGGRPPYVPWNFSFTIPARDRLLSHFGDVDLEALLDNHFVMLGDEIGFFEEVGPDLFRDGFGVVWDRSIDKDIGNVRDPILVRPSLAGYSFPDPTAARFFESIEPLSSKYPDRFRVFAVGFSLYERAWALRGMQNLMMDFIEHPEFVRDLLRVIADWNIAHVKRALTYDIDCVFFGDDWGQQRGLQMGPRIWREFIQPEVARMYRVVREAGRYVMIHSCGDCDELFDDLVSMGVNCFNPFQPEVMEIASLMKEYRGRLSFFGGLSTQKTLPYGTVEDVRRETEHLIALGEAGSYILAPAHDVPGDVPLENMLAFIDTARRQRGYEDSA
ncbi:MAG: uroporphyrinogen-III decarboxylase-like protein [Armatimonadetes bacterium]|nr:uroporphyrinogen-III decarboxylase-like protein [Armatimonadota bacterium]